MISLIILETPPAPQSYAPQLVITIGATLVSLASMAVTLWSARQQRHAEVELRRLDDAHAARRKRDELLDAQIMAVEILRSRVAEMVALMRLREQRPNHDRLKQRFSDASVRLDEAIDGFITGWAGVRTSLPPSPWSATEAAQRSCVEALDGVVNAVIVGNDSETTDGEVFAELSTHAAHFDSAATTLITFVLRIRK